MTATVVHWDERPRDGNYVYIGRMGEGLFGNPYVLGRDGDRQGVLQKYALYFADRLHYDAEFKAAVHALHGRVLVCHCKPLLCHGDVIAEYLNR